MTLFDWLNQITYEKKPWNSFTEEEKESFNCYMVHRFLSMNPEYIEFVNLVQTFPYTDKEKTYNIVGPFLEGETKNKNKRVYPFNLLEKEISVINLSILSISLNIISIICL